MTPNEYQKLAARTLIDRPDAQYTDKQLMLVWCAVGLGGESGEVLEVVKKGVFHQHGVDEAKLRKEIGDAQWYLSAICTVMGWQLEGIMAENIAKLEARYPNGYNSDASKNRRD